MDYIQRTLAGELALALEQYPVVTVLGPRQSGKTTFVRHEHPEFGYANLEDPESRALASEDPKVFFSAFKRPIIIDEVQRVPELLSSIQVISDSEGLNGQFILTGSHQLKLGAAISQSLAGRTAVLTLLPLSIEELGDQAQSRESLLFQGFLPRVYDQKQEPGRAYRNYFQTYVERDVRTLLMIKDLSKFETFMRLLAGRIGQLFVASALAGEIGVSHKTVQEWLSILEASYIVYKLRPFHANYGKRLVKTSKLYFVEPGLAVYLLGIETPEQLGRDPLFSNLFENMVVMEALKARVHRGKESNLYFYRDSNGSEVDLVLDRRPEPLGIEIKSAMSWHPDFQKNLFRFRELNKGSDPGYLVYSGELESSSDNIKILNFRHTAGIFR